jgi:hypothetical protein
MKVLVSNFLSVSLSSSVVCPNITFDTLFSDTLKLRYSLSVRDQILFTYKTTDKINVLYTVQLGVRIT